MGSHGRVSAPLEALLRIDRIYNGSNAGSTSQLVTPGAVSLRRVAAELDVRLELPPSEATVLVIGDVGSGKSAFINALVQELVLPLGPAPRPRPGQEPPGLAWVRSANLPSASVPRLLAQLVTEFPEWKGVPDVSLCLAAGGCSASPRLDGVQIIETATPADETSEAVLSWLAVRVDVVVCLLDSQRQPPLSDSLLRCLGRMPRDTEKPELQFVLAKADLIARDSEKIRIVAKASRLLSEKLGRGFKVIPAATGVLSGLLDGLDGDEPSSITVGNQSFVWDSHTQESKCDAGPLSTQEPKDAAPLRAIFAAQACASTKLSEGLATLKADCERLKHKLEEQLEDMHKRAKASSHSVRHGLLQACFALVIAAVCVPFVLEEVEDWIVQMWIGVSLGIAALLLLIAFLVHSPPPDPNIGDKITELLEYQRFVGMVMRQSAIWGGFEPETVSSMGAGPRDDSTTPTAAMRRPGSDSGDSMNF